MREILTYPNPLLREKAENVDVIDQPILDLIEEMGDMMYDDDGIGLAATQVGVSRRIIVIDAGEGFSAYINPEIVEKSEAVDSMEEGCLSLPGVRVTISRSSAVKVKAQNLKGEESLFEAEGLLARVFQHEIDHLNGVLIIDHASPLQRRLMRSRLRKIQKEK